jgi:hypothetical protein
MGTLTHHSTLRSDTRSVSIKAPADLVFEFVADPENLPRWAVGFCRSIRPGTNGEWVVSTSQGDISVRYVADPALGVVDFHMFPAPGVEAIAFSRVLPSGDGAEYVFTQLQPIGMPDEAFEGQVRALIEELQLLKGLLQAQAACPL